MFFSENWRLFWISKDTTAVHDVEYFPNNTENACTIWNKEKSKNNLDGFISKSKEARPLLIL